jgi:hypothetical protein
MNKMAKNPTSRRLSIGKLYTKKRNDRSSFFVIGSGVLLIFLTLVFQPKVSNMVFAFNRQRLLGKFLEQARSDQFTMRQFWQFREFYSPGTFQFNNQAVMVGAALEFLPSTSEDTTLLTYDSPYMKSEEKIVNPQSLDDWIKSHGQSAKEVLFHSEDRYIYRDEDNALHLIFLRPTDEMIATNGFFDYSKKEKDLLKTRLWLSQSTLYE